jgi:O-methyltransferase
MRNWFLLSLELPRQLEMNFAIKQIRAFFVSRGLFMTRCQPVSGDVPIDFNEADSRLHDYVRRYTLTSAPRVKVLADAVRHLVDAQIPGAIVECGVWKGGSMMAVAYTLQHLKADDRKLYLFDVFEDAMPRATEVDVTRDGTRLKDKADAETAPYWNFATESEVKSNMMSTGYPESFVRFVRGPLEQTLPDGAPEQCALIRLDTDLYGSTKHELESLYPRLVRGGVIIIDDYGSHQGVKKAVDEFNASLPKPLFFVRVDEAGRVAVKP